MSKEITIDVPGEFEAVIDIRSENPETFYEFCTRISGYPIDTRMLDLVGDIMKDDDFPRGRESYEDYVAYFEDTGIPRRVFEVFERIYVAYRCGFL